MRFVLDLRKGDIETIISKMGRKDKWWHLEEPTCKKLIESFTEIKNNAPS